MTDQLVYRYTVFPNLHAKVNAENTGTLNSGNFPLPANSTQETLILGWAFFLRGHVPGETAIFRVDNQDVNVEFDGRKITYIPNEQVEMPAEDKAAGRFSVVYFQDAPGDICPQLYLTADIATATMCLFASSEIAPPAHLQALAEQLSHIVANIAVTSFALTPSFPASSEFKQKEQATLPHSGLSILNPHPKKLPGPTLLHQLIHFSGHGYTTALDFLHASGQERTTYSYAELDILSTQFALKLIPHLPKSSGTALTVTVLLPQSPALYVALLGILKAGAAFVPLNLDAPTSRIQFVANDVGASCIVTNNAFSTQFTWDTCPPIVLVEDDDLDTSTTSSFSLQGLLSLPDWINPRSPAYIMYTSGSTGAPKGVSISHSAATQSLLAHDRHIPHFSRWLQFAAPTFDVFVFEMFFPLFRGAVLVGCERGRLLADLPGCINHLDIDATELTPTVADRLLGRREDVPGLKVLLTIGEMLTRQIVDEYSGGVLQGMYGPTEAAVHCTLASNFCANAKVGDIGVPLDTVSVYIIGPPAEVEVLPLGWVGELAIGGYQLADGYLNRPELTTEVFLESKVYGRIYRTGDRARILPAGRIECLGRVGAGQIKLRGQRVELGEVEEVVRKTSGVKSAAASVLGSTMVVFVGGKVEKAAVLETCRKWLPTFMVPGDVVIFEELPGLPSGKMDRKRLDREYSEMVRGKEACVEETLRDGERVLVDTVAKLLGVRPSRNGSLIALGLDSIQAIRLAAALKLLGLKVEVVDVLKADTIAGIADIISDRNDTNDETSQNETVTERFSAVRSAGLSKIPSKDIKDVADILPCTATQESMLAETAQDASAYCNWILLEFPLSLDATAIEKAFRSVIDRNEILRTGFTVVGGGFAQVVWCGSRAGQFITASSWETEWSITMEGLLEPPFSATLVRIDNVWKLSVQIHHALYDGWSWEQVLADFNTLLRNEIPLARPQFRKVVEYELSRPLAIKETSREAWRKALDGFSPVRFPNLHGHSAVDAGVGTESLTLQTSRVSYEAAARGLGVSPQTIVQAAWAFLLSFYIHSSDVVFGTVVAGRMVSMEGIEDVLGPTILTLPIRVDVNRGRMVSDVVSDVAKRSRECMISEVGLREIRKACGVEDALFESLLVWQQTLEVASEGAVKMVDSSDRLEFAILIEIEPGAETISLRTTYQHAVLPQAQVKLMLSQLDQFVSGIIAHPEYSLSSLQNLLNENLLSIENPNPLPAQMAYAPSLASLFENSVVKSPNAIALEFADDILDGTLFSMELTYVDLNSKANKLAHHLLSLGILPDQLVCVCMEKSPMLYISILAILKAGAGYLPLTPETPKERMLQILENAEVRVCLTTSQLERILGIPEGVKAVCIDKTNVTWFSESNPEVERRGETLAYAVFTSGSTGVPKGVLIENRSIVDNLLVLKEIYPTKSDSKMLQFCSIAFDVSVFEIFFTWSLGMTLCSGTKDILLRDIEGAINSFGVTHLSMTATVAALVKPENVPCVEFLVVAGEAVSQKVFNDWADRGLYQGYGPSETVNICTVKPQVKKTDCINNIGAPFLNTSAFVVSDQDEKFSLLPRGGVGELCFGGAQVGRGYLKMPELTNHKFVAHPKYGRLYRSGDIGRILSDGSLEFLGRQDDQIKTRGLRIELGEISSVLLKSADVIDSMTMPIEKQENGGGQLIAFVVLGGRQDKEFAIVRDSEDVRHVVMKLFGESLRLLPSYMIPTAIIPVTTMPMTTQGKIDRRVLKAVFLGMDSCFLDSYIEQTSDRHDDKEWTRDERNIVNIIAEVAQVTVDEIGRDTSIFKLGLDSISAIQLSNRIVKEGYQRLDISQIMRNPTVGALAALLEDQQPNTQAKDETARDLLQKFANEVRVSVLKQLEISEEDVVKILPCTPLQEAMLSQKKGMDAKTYYNHTVFNLKADVGRLKEAWETMAERHEIMRTCFCVTSHLRHAYAQVIHKRQQLPWRVFEVEATATLIDERINEVSSLMETERTPYFFSLFVESGKTTMLMSFHHSLYDGFAMELLLGDVRRAYHGLDLPARHSFDPVLEYMENIDLAAADKFWANMLTGFEPSSFPDLTGKSSIFRQNLVGMSSSKISCSRPLNLIEEDCRNLSTSLLALGQTGWARLLSVYSGETDLCFGSVVSGRTIPVEGVEDIVAPCFNTIPLRIQLTAGSTNMSVIENLQRLNADVLPYQLTPLRRIMTILKTEGQRLFDTLFILQHAHQSSFEDLWEEIEDRGEMDFSIVVELVPSRNKNSLEIILHFRRDMVLEEHADVLLRQLDETIISSILNPAQLSVDFSNLSPELLSTANTKLLSVASADQELIHSEFVRHARQNPSRNALEYLNSDGTLATWTFETLNRASNQVAHYLISLGLKRDEAVPLCLEKSPIFYICVLGVLKAGCAFTPIDPSLPSQRKLFMIEELGAKIVLADHITAYNLSPPAPVEVIDIDSALLVKSQPDTNPKVQDLSPSHLAYRLYTSGSTGQPKAVSLEIKSAVQTFRSSRALIPWKENSKLLQFAATTFDMCYYDCFMAWTYGFTLCSAAKNHLLDDLEGTIKILKASMLDLTPTVASTLVAENLPDVKMLYCIGEAMPQKLVNDWDGRCLNSYGPTEAAMCCTITPTSKQTKSANIGKPFPTASFFVLSPDGEYIVPTFGSGELCIGGPQVAREYYNNPQLTKNCFIQLGKERVYRTGDLVRLLANDTFEFIGRADDQVKIRGLRVELDEISSVLREGHSSIKDASTIVLRHTDNANKQLVSFLAVEGRKQHGTVPMVAADSRTGIILAASRQAAWEKLPRYMIPGIILVLDHIPRSAAGKVDKKTLGALFKAQDIQSFGVSNVGDEDENPWTEDECKIREIFSLISQVPIGQISRSSTIYEIGLDSISAAQVAMQLKHIGLQVSVLDILERPSISQISEFLFAPSKASTPDGEASSEFLSKISNRFMESILVETGIPKNKIAGIYPCTPAQEGMLSQFLRSKGGLYFNHVVFALSEGIDLTRLRQSWNSVFKTHEMLRAGFLGVDDVRHSFAIVIHEQDSIALPWSVVNSSNDTAKLVSIQKETHTLRALETLHLPPWSITVLKRDTGNHVLIFSAHHALYDARSLSLILNDVLCGYSGKHIPQRPSFSKVLFNIVRHTVEQEVLEEDKRFWASQLQGSSISRFPNMCPLRVKSTLSHVFSTEISWSLSKVEGACQRLGISVNAAGQAAWARVLSAYMGDDTITMGIVLSGRAGIENAEEVSFPCITTIPSLCVLAGTNRELALALQENNAKILKHQHTPLRFIQSWFDHPQESFFDSIFVYQKMESGAAEPDSIWKTIEEEAFVDYTISLELEPTDVDSLLVRATCRNNIVPQEQTKLMVDHFEAALMDILEHPNNSATNFTGFPQELLSCTPAQVDEIPTDTHLLHKFVEKYRQLTPEKIAFEFATSIQKGSTVKKTWTYTQLDEEGNRIANYLLNHGVKTGDIIGICFEKCPEASFAILGILKAGCGFLALDYNAPVARKAFVVEDSGAKCVLTMDKFLRELRTKIGVDVVALESDIAIKHSSIETPTVTDLTPNDLCYCLYTSGTTGTPKGCEITHENAIQAMLAFQNIFNSHWDAESRFLQFASFHFDVSVLEQFWSWSVGICVASAPRDLIFQDIPLTINELQITHLDLTPSLAALLRPQDVPSLCRGVFITGGEQLKQEILDTWGETGVIYNGYGPTEVTIGCTMYPRVPASGKPSNIGPQFDNVGSFVLVPGTDKPVLRGAIGELCVSGKLVGRGYLNRPALTEERFPFLERFGARIYRTGDLVRILHDDTFDFAGRADDQVKLRGQRLEIGEINATLKQASSKVEAVATLVLRHPKQQKDQLVSFIVLDTSDSLESSEPIVLNGPEQRGIIPIVTDSCKSKLPTYMVPTHFIPISKMPLSINNKVDYKKLTTLYQETSLILLQQISGKEETQERNWTDAEQRIRKILADMTGLQAFEIKLSSTVFELGLDSVSVVGLTRRLKKDGFFASSVSLVMQYPSVKQLAVELAKENNNLQDFSRTESIRQRLAVFATQSTFEVCERLELELDKIDTIVPCTALQEGMILRFLDSDKPLYYNSFSFSLHELTDINLLQRAWNTVVKSTGVLRTCFCETSDGYAQVVRKDSLIQWQEITVKNGEIQDTISKEMTKHISRNKDLHQPPFHLLLLRTPLKCILVVNIFHALYDGNSLPLIFKDIQMAYHNQFKPRSLQFSDIIGQLLSVDLDNARRFWEASLMEIKPTSFPELSGTSAYGDHLVQIKPKISTENVEKFCRKFNCTSQAIFQAAWASVLSFQLGPRFAFGIVVSGRSLPFDNIEDTIGPLFNTIPCTLDVENALSWEKLVQQAHRFNSESIAYHHTPLHLINKWMHVSSEKPLFDTLFVYQRDLTRGDTDIPSLWEIVDSSTVADYPLALEIEESLDDGLSFSIVAKNSVLTQNLSLELLNDLEKQLHSILIDPQGKPAMTKDSESNSSTSTESSFVEDTDGTEHGFAWGLEAQTLRKTIATLANIGEFEFDEDSSIFELGLDSIEAIKLSSRLRSNGMKLSVSTIMRNPTIRKLQNVLGQCLKATKDISSRDQIAIFEQQVRQGLEGRKHNWDFGQIEAIYPTTPLQEGMIAETLASDYKLYFNHDVLELDSEVDLETLHAAWESVIQKNEILRTSFFHVSEIFSGSQHTFGQIVHKQAKLDWSEVILDSKESVIGMIKDFMKNASKNINMLQKPPLKITILLAPEARYLVLSLSHALYDGWSMRVLRDDVQTAYFSSAPSRPSCRILLENIFSINPKDSDRFWKQMLSGASASAFPLIAKESPSAVTYRFERQSALPFWKIQTFCKRVGVTVQSLGKTCWALLLAHYTGEPDVLFGTVLSGRDLESAEEIIFPAMNTIPVRAIAHGSYKNILQYMQDNSARVLKYQHTPLRQIQKLVGSQGLRLFDTLFIYQRSRESTGAYKKSLWHSIEGASDVEYNVCVEMEHSGKNLVWRNACKSTAMTAKGAKELLQILDSLLGHVVENMDHPTMTYCDKGIAFGNIQPKKAGHSTGVANLNGTRIDLDETAAIIQKGHIGIQNSVAIVSTEGGRNLLVVFITGRGDDGQEMAGDETISRTLAKFARQTLPYWSIPSFVIPIDKLPLEDNKIDRTQLESHFLCMSLEERSKYTVEEQNSEWSPLELTFRHILSRASQLPEAEIERTQTIFHLGLDSISVIGVSSELRKESIFLSVAEILHAATIERMAILATTVNDVPRNSMDTEKSLEDGLKNINIQQLLNDIPGESIENISPGTSGQFYMLSTWKNSNYKLFMPTFTFKCRKFEISHILSAWESVVRQEPILRTIFLLTEDENTPLIQLTLRNPPTQHEWYQSSATNNDAFVRFLVSEEQQKPANLGVPQVRLTILSTPVNTVILLTIHHALYDGVSLPLLLARFQGLLEHGTERLPTPDPEAPAFSNFVTLARSQDIQRQSNFWKKYLDSSVSTLVPLKHPDVKCLDRTELFQPGTLSECNLLESRCRAEGVSLHSVFLAAYSKVYAYHLSLQDGPINQREDVIFGIYLSNRHLPVSNLAFMTAPTLNILPLRVRSPRTTSLIELSQQIQGDLVEIGSPSNSVVGLWQVDKWTGVRVDCFFNFLKFPSNSREGYGNQTATEKNRVTLEEVKVDVRLQPEVERVDTVSGNRWMDSAKTNLDIEVAVRGDKIDVGVFSWPQYFSNEDAKNSIDWMCEIVKEGLKI